jgi:hypothetical protein
MASLQQENKQFVNTHERLEGSLYSQGKEMDALKKECQQLKKTKNDTEKKLMLEVNYTQWLF